MDNPNNNNNNNSNNNDNNLHLNFLKRTVLGGMEQGGRDKGGIRDKGQGPRYKG